MRKYFLLVLVLLLSSTVKAESSDTIQTSLGVFPAIIETVLDPQTTIEKTVTLTNLSNFSQPIKALKQSFTPSEKSSFTQEELEIYDASSWIYITPEDSDFILQPKESKEIILYITQPKNALPGGHYATIYFQPLIPQEVISSQSIYIYARVAVLVFMQTPGDIIEDISIKNINYSYFNNPGKLNFNIDIENTGNTHLHPIGNIKVYNSLNNELVSTLSFPSSIILPGTIKTFPVEFPVEELFGAYSLTVELNYGADQILLNSSPQYFLVLPYTVILVFILPALLLLIYLIKFGYRIKTAIRILMNKEAGKVVKTTTYPTSMYKLEPRLKFKVKKTNR